MLVCNIVQILNMELKNKIEAAWADRNLLKEESYSNAVRAVIEEIDKGRLRVAEPKDNQWVEIGRAHV